MNNKQTALSERGKQMWQYLQDQLGNRQRLEEKSGTQEAEEFMQAVPPVSEAVPEVAKTVPWSLRVAAAWSWRVLVILAALAVFLFALSHLMVVVVPVLVALLLAVLLEPMLRFLYLKCHLPRTLASIISLLVGVGIVWALLYLATSQIMSDVSNVVERAQAGINQGISWLHNGPLKLDTTQASSVFNEVQSRIAGFVKNHASALASNAVATASSLASLFTGFLTALFCLFFFLKDGRKIWQWILRLCPRETRNPLNEAAIRGWITLGSYARTQMLVAAIDAVGIGGGAFLIGVPFPLALGVLVFLASFVPIVGAIVSGFIAVAVALVNSGFQTAVFMLLIILAVQQIESNLLQPALMSNAVNLHPMAVLLLVSAGGFLAGIAGAVFTVPLVAFVNTVVLYLKGYDNFLYLNYQQDRPGGPPGSLDQEMAEASRPSKANIEAARKAKQAALEAGQIRKAHQRVAQAETIKHEVAESLREFKEDDTVNISPENPTLEAEGTKPGPYVTDAEAETKSSD